jgi:hypothetical protein
MYNKFMDIIIAEIKKDLYFHINISAIMYILWIGMCLLMKFELKI